ncbi:MAG: hypothetical protein JST47_05705 [Bacteroidetes bacterium]|nr:hypothetical protein [Bacteroidota bacterium]
MKKVFFAFALLLLVKASIAQTDDILGNVPSAASATGFDVNTLTKNIMGQLEPALSLTKAQAPKVTSAVSSYLSNKSKILPYMSSDKEAYAKKQSNLFGALKTKLAGILVKQQMNKFLGLKPATNDAENILSKLFY